MASSLQIVKAPCDCEIYVRGYDIRVLICGCDCVGIVKAIVERGRYAKLLRETENITELRTSGDTPEIGVRPQAPVPAVADIDGHIYCILIHLRDHEADILVDVF